jgi:hypothetical protein
MHPRLGRILRVFVFLAGVTTTAQFKEIGKAPFTEPVARQRIRALLEAPNLGNDPGNRQKTIDTLTGWTVWYRNLIDEELIAAWQKDTRSNLTTLIGPMADPKVASAVVEFSWRQERQAAFIPSYSTMLGDLMERFPESAKPFLNDLLVPIQTGQPAPPLTQSEAETVCRILIDMPDIGTWRKTAQQILPRYRAAAEQLLNQDSRSDDRETSYRAQVWLREIRPEPPTPVRVPLARPRPAYDGPKSGILECNGGPVPEGSEYVFRNLPPVNLELDYDTKIWDAHISPGEHQTQRVVLINRSNSPQKKCVVRWRVIP